MATLCDHYFPAAAALRPGPVSPCPDSDIGTIAWLLELIGKDSELSGYKLIQAQLGHLFRFLPEKSRFNRRRRKLWSAEKYAQLATALSKEKNATILLFAGSK